MVNCKRVQDVLSDYIEGSLSKETLQHVEDHIQACLTCRHLNESVRNTVHLLGSLSEISPSDTFEQNLRVKIRAERSREGHRIWNRMPSFPRLRPWPALVVSMTLLAVGLFLFRGSLFQEQQPLFLTDSNDQRKIERVNMSPESTSVFSPSDMDGESFQIPNYILSTFSPQTSELQGEFHSPWWESSTNDQSLSEKALMLEQWYRQNTVRYVLPSAQPQATMKTVTFNP